MRLRICLAGSRDLPLLKMPRLVVAQLVRARKILLRHPRTAGALPGLFEATVAKMATALDIEVGWFLPEPGGREQVFLRDLAMVGKSDLVVAFFSSAVMDGGTAHVVEAAMARDVTVEAYHVDPDGMTHWIGGFDPGADGP